ncbi:hypothetical protein J3Q64DRAFT_1150817 [Phycomyces blakesleeanus]|uniref:Uncharacterized protein n=1 Tax=Phycomyces blakesleeanus TaxID=4837 RepID=A0ABR3AVE1_PHYBL
MSLPCAERNACAAHERIWSVWQPTPESLLPAPILYCRLHGLELGRDRLSFLDAIGIGFVVFCVLAIGFVVVVAWGVRALCIELRGTIFFCVGLDWLSLWLWLWLFTLDFELIESVEFWLALLGLAELSKRELFECLCGRDALR